MACSKLKFAALFLIMSLMAVLPAAAQDTWYVSVAGDDVAGDGSEGNPWRTIQHAVDSAAAGDTINVSPGVYEEVIDMDKPLALVGTGAPKPVIRPSAADMDGTRLRGFFQGNVEPVILVDYAVDSPAEIRNFEIDGGGFNSQDPGNFPFHFYGGIFFAETSGTVEEVDFRDIHTGTNIGIGVVVNDDSGADKTTMITGCDFDTCRTAAVWVENPNAHAVIEYNAVQRSNQAFVFFSASPGAASILHENTVTDSLRALLAYPLSGDVWLEITDNLFDHSAVIPNNDFDLIVTNDGFAGHNARLEIDNNTFVGFWDVADPFGGLTSRAMSSVGSVAGSSITNNVFRDFDRAIFTDWTGADYSNVVISGNIFENIHNRIIHFGAIDVQGLDTALITNNSFNDLAAEYGVFNATADVLDARHNWWGGVSGPEHADNPAGAGNRVSDNVLFDPWFGMPPAAPEGPDSCVIGVNYEYTTEYRSPLIEALLQYQFHWDDGTVSGWSASRSALKMWTSTGNYPVRARARFVEDERFGAGGWVSDWSEALDVAVVKSGSLAVTIQPEAARAAGAQWRRAGQAAWRDSGTTELNVPVGNHVVEFRDVAGWVKPADIAVAINENETTARTGTYTAPAGTGSLTVEIEPEEVREDARWRLAGGAWRGHGETEPNLVPGNYTVEFNEVAGWVKPANINVAVGEDEAVETTGTYVRTADTGSLTVTILPSAARDAGAMWRRKGTDTWRASGTTETDVPAGEHTVEFKDVDGWDAPEDKDVTVNPGLETSATGTYIPVDPDEPPGVAEPVSPEGAQANLDLAYRWQAAPGATWYRLWINRDGVNTWDRWYEVGVDVFPENGIVSVYVPSHLADASYEWWVQAWNPAGYGQWSAGMQFTTEVNVPGVITLMGPAGAQDSLDLTYMWRHDARATWYRLWVRRTMPGGGVFNWSMWYRVGVDVFPAADGSVSVYLPGHFAGADYEWWVQGWAPAGYGPWSSVMLFNTR